MINKQLINLSSPASSGGEEGLILHLDANDVDSYDGNGSEWVDITDHEYTPTTNVSEHFNTVTYTGNSGDKTVTGVGFAPDLVWIKNRDGAFNHLLRDTVRGNDSYLLPNTTNAESTSTGIFEFLNDGFRLPIASSGANNSAYDYVAWCFKAGGAPSGSDKVSIDGTSYATMSAAELTDGTEPIDKLSVNTKLGFSVVKYTAPALTADTVAHGLGESPEMIILKSTSETRNWNVFHKYAGLSKNLHLNTQDNGDSGEYWTANSSTFSIQDLTASADWIAYCFASKRGVSKVGSYVGGGAGNKIYTGFEPAFVIVKRTNNTGSWEMYDNARGKTKKLWANETSQEVTNTSPSYIEFNRDGFTFPITSAGSNSSGDSYIYYAVAKNTNETSLIPDTDLELHLDAASFPEYGEAGYFPTPFTWIDSSVNGNNGTINFATFDSELGNYLNIPLDSNYIDVPTANMLDSDFTIEMWYNISSTSSSYKMLLGGSEYQNQTGLGHYIYGDTLKTWVSISGATTNVLTSQSALIANTWHHIVLRREGSTWTQYVDGNEVGTATGTTSSLSSANSRIGRHYNLTGLNAAGKSGQVRIYSSALTQDQIRQNFNFTKPSYPNGYDGAITGAVWNAGGYFDFDGSNNYITLPFNTTFSEFSFHAWVNPDSTIGDYHAILGKWWDGSNRSFFLTGLNQILKVDLAYSDSNTDNIFGSTALPDATWSFVCVTWKNYEGLTLTVNDTTETFSINKAIRSNTNSWYIGNQDSRIIKQWDGKISQCKMYDKKLSPTEITAAYNATKSAYGL